MVCATGRKREATAAVPLIGPSIAGGFVQVPAASLMAAWRACRSDPLGIGDFRTWLACREMVARRCLAEQGRAPAYSFAELARLLGVAEKRARASANRMVTAGLLRWSEHDIGFPEPPGEPDPALEDSIGRGRGDLAIPRRILRYMAAGARPALISTVLGVLLRCLSRRRGGFHGRGRVKSAWIARAFGVDLRRVKKARRELVALGWIHPEPSGQRAENLWGRAFGTVTRIDLTWDRPAPAEGRSLPPLVPADRPEIATPSVNQEPFQERNQHQEPGSAGPAGIRLAESEGGRKPLLAPTSPAATQPAVPPASPPAAMACEPAPSPTMASRPPIRPAAASPGGPPTARPATPSTPSPAVPGPVRPKGDLPPPRLADVRVEDLKDTGRLLELLGQAVARGLVTGSEGDRLRAVSAAEHALAIGEVNPGGLFAYLIRNGLWQYITQEDEDRANARIKAFLRGPELPRVKAAFRPPSRPALSEDARAVGELRRAFAAARYPGDPFPQVRRHDPSWTRGRWDEALTELERSR